VTETRHNTLVVLDRDGVINRDSANYIRGPEQWLALPGSLQAIRRLTEAGFQIVVATNQSGLGRGLFNHEALAAIHQRMRAEVSAAGGQLAGIYFCPHHPNDGCDCRKPAAGLLRQIERDFAVSLAGRPVIGDSARDLDAARAVAGRPILVRTGNGLDTEQNYPHLAEIEVYDDLSAAADALIAAAERS
jgi:D-glycero-D-manno-heptose 1,7-bisphosphate phosphatase